MIRCNNCNKEQTENCLIAWKCPKCGKVFKMTQQNIKAVAEKKQLSGNESVLICPDCKTVLDDGSEIIAWKCSCGGVNRSKLSDYLDEDYALLTLEEILSAVQAQGNNRSTNSRQKVNIVLIIIVALLAVGILSLLLVGAKLLYEYTDVNNIKVVVSGDNTNNVDIIDTESAEKLDYDDKSEVSVVQLTEEDVIKEAFCNLRRVRKELKDENYESISKEIMAIQDAITQYENLAKNPDSEYSKFCKVVINSSICDRLKSDYCEQDKDYDSDAYEQKAHRLVIKTYLEWILAKGVPFEDEECSKYVASLKKEFSREDANSSFYNLTRAYNRLGWDIHKDGDHVYIAERSFGIGKGVSAYPDIFIGADGNRGIGMVVSGETNNPHNPSVLEFHTEENEVVLGNKYKDEIEFTSDDYQYAFFNMHSNTYTVKKNKKFYEIKKFFEKNKNGVVDIYLDGKNFYTLSLDEVETMRQYLFLYEIIIDRYVDI